MAQTTMNLSSSQETISLPTKSFYGKKLSLDVPIKVRSRNLSRTIDVPRKRKRVKSMATGRPKKRIKRETFENKTLLIKPVEKQKIPNKKFFNSGRLTTKTFTLLPKKRVPLAALKLDTVAIKANNISAKRSLQKEVGEKEISLKDNNSGDILGALLLTKLNVVKKESEIEEDNNFECSKKRAKLSFRKDDKTQMMIDAGQKNVESVICHQCGMLYLPNSLEDSALHYKFHNQSLDTVPFRGWKSERVVREYEDGRVILVLSNDSKFTWKKIEEVQIVMDTSLGINDQLKKNNSMQAFLFVSNKEIIGCVMAEAISKAYRVVERETIAEPLSRSNVSQRAVCGINRIWTSTAFRRKKIASRLMDCVKSSFYYGCGVPDDQIAFSDPSPIGQKFASSYLKTEAYLVY